MSAESQPISDEELARQCQAGSLLAFEELVYRYEHRVFRFIANSCRSNADARELTQDTFVRAFQGLAQFDSRKDFAPWLFTIARRKCVDLYRARRPIADEPVPELSDPDDPAELLARQEDRQNLWQLARRRLPQPQFQALWLKYAEAMSVAEVAQILRKTRTHVKVLLFRARQTLGRELRVGQASRLPGSPWELRVGEGARAEKPSSPHPSSPQEEREKTPAFSRTAVSMAVESLLKARL